MSCNNTNSTCTSCNHNYSSCNNKCAKCGCKDSFLTSPPPCPTPAGCPDPIPCQEVLSSDCIIYNGLNIECNGDVVITSDSTLTELLEDIVDYFCVPPINEFKYLYETDSLFDGDIFTILRSDLVACGLGVGGCYSTELVSEKCDLHVRLYYLFGGFWKSIPEKPFGIASTEGYELNINSITGDIVITLNIAPIEPAVRVRVVILA
jgi:hypothetical protein